MVLGCYLLFGYLDPQYRGSGSDFTFVNEGPVEALGWVFGPSDTLFP